MRLFLRKTRKNSSKENKVIDSSSSKNQSEITGMLKSSDHDSTIEHKHSEKQPIEIDLINKKLPKELIIRILSYLDIVSLCRCAQVSKVK